MGRHATYQSIFRDLIFWDIFNIEHSFLIFKLTDELLKQYVKSARCWEGIENFIHWNLILPLSAFCNFILWFIISCHYTSWHPFSKHNCKYFLKHDCKGQNRTWPSWSFSRGSWIFAFNKNVLKDLMEFNALVRIAALLWNPERVRKNLPVWF